MMVSCMSSISITNCAPLWVVKRSLNTWIQIQMLGKINVTSLSTTLMPYTYGCHLYIKAELSKLQTFTGADQKCLWPFCQIRILRPSYLHNGISYTDKMTSLYWIGSLAAVSYIHMEAKPIRSAMSSSWLWSLIPLAPFTSMDKH